MTAKRSLLFIAPWPLFPADSGGKLRTADILKYLNKLDFSVTLLSPALDDAGLAEQEKAEICDRFIPWPATERGRFFNLTRLLNLFSELPIPVATDRSAAARRAIANALGTSPAIVVVDFVHTHVLMPDRLHVPSVLFTHNVESEIFERHANVAANPLLRAVWRNQYDKMVRFEASALKAYDRVVSVSERDSDIFVSRYGLPRDRVRDIATGLDLERYTYRNDTRDVSADGGHLVFTASMNSAANIDAVEWFMDDVWPLLRDRRPNLEFKVAGRNPPPGLVKRAAEKGYNWTFTGAVPSVEPFVHDADLYVIPLRVGGGTRLKVIEAIAMGTPLVSTDIGVEGIELIDGEHYARANTPAEFAERIDGMLADRTGRHALSHSAYRHVSDRFGMASITKQFQAICHEAIASAKA